MDAPTLEWAASWIEGSLTGETNERVIEFGRNMAMTLRAATQATKSSEASHNPGDTVAGSLPHRTESSESTSLAEVDKATPRQDSDAERLCVLGLIDRFQREPNRSQATINALEWLRRQINEGNHVHHVFEVATTGAFKPDECFRCGLPKNAIMHLAAVGHSATSPDVLPVAFCPECAKGDPAEFVYCPPSHKQNDAV